jgi:hypothetical protein
MLQRNPAYQNICAEFLRLGAAVLREKRLKFCFAIYDKPCLEQPYWLSTGNVVAQLRCFRREARTAENPEAGQ